MPNKLPEWWNSDEIDKIVQSTSPTTNFSPSTSQVDQILQEAESPSFLEKPEDGFKLPKDLSTISKLRKQGYDDKTIIESLQSELAEAEASSTEVAQPKSEGPAGPPEKQAPTFFERLYLPIPRTFVGGGLKQDVGGLLQSAGAVRPSKRKADVSYYSGDTTIEPEVTIEEAVKKTQENPLFKMGLKLYAQGVEDFQNNPDLQQTDNPFDYNYTDPRFIASAIGEAIPSLLTGVIPATVATIATKNPSVGVATMVATQFGIETGSMMNTALDEGLSPGDASTVALTVGMINGLISTIPAYSLFKKLGFGKKVTNDILVKGIIDRGLYKNISKGALEQGLAEMTEEILQEGVNIIAESTKLGKDISAEEIKDRLAMSSIGGFAVGGTLGGGAKGVQYKSIDKADKIQKEQSVKPELARPINEIQNLADEISKDKTNNFNIKYNDEDSGEIEFTQAEFPYDVDINKFEKIGENENGEAIYRGYKKGENSIQDGISLNSGSDKSTILEETVEYKLKELQTKTDSKSRGLVEKINNWTNSIRETASKMGLDIRFLDTAEGNIELFSDAMVYHYGGYSDLDSETASLTYIPQELAEEFKDVMGKMSDGIYVYDKLAGTAKRGNTSQDFATEVVKSIETRTAPLSQIKTEKPTAQLAPRKRNKKTGQYIAFPPSIKSSQGLGALRKLVTGFAKEGESRRFWYENSGKALLDISNNNKDDALKLLQMIAITSPQRRVKENFREATKALYQHIQGVPLKAGAFPQTMQKKLQAVLDGKEWSGLKTDRFYKNLAEVIKNKDDKGVTVDVWMMRAFGYPTDSPTDAQYKIVEEETQDIGRKLGWEPHQVQASIWSTAKARWEAIWPSIMKEAKTKGDYKPKVGWKSKQAEQIYRNKAFQKMRGIDISEGAVGVAGFDYADAIKATSARISMETTPSTSVDILPGIHSAPLKLKALYDHDIRQVLADMNGQDRIMKILSKNKNIQVPVIETFNAPGFYEGVSNPATHLEIPASYLEGPIAKRQYDKVLDDGTKNILETYGSIYGLVTVQDGIGYSKEFQPKSKNQANSIGLYRNDLQPQEMSDIYDLIREKTGVDTGILPTHYGGVIINWMDNKGNPYSEVDNNTFYNQVDSLIENYFKNKEGVVTLERATSLGGLVENDWKEFKNGQNYKKRISKGRQPNVAVQLAREIRSEIEEVNTKYSEKYGWGNPVGPTFQLSPVGPTTSQHPFDVLEQTQQEKSLEIPEQTIYDRVIGAIQDKLRPLDKFQQSIADKFDTEIDESRDALLHAELFIGRASKRVRNVFRDIYDVNSKKSFVSRLKKADIDIDDFGRYLHARHAEERNIKMAEKNIDNEDMQDGGSGLTTQDAKALIKKINKKNSGKGLVKFYNEFKKTVVDADLDNRLKEGLISQEDYDGLKGTYKNYVPLFRVFEDQDDIRNFSSRTRGFSTEGKEYLSAKGSKRQVVNPFIGAITQLEMGILRAEKNKVSRKLLALVESIDTDEINITGIPHRPRYNQAGEIEYMDPSPPPKKDEFGRNAESIDVKINGASKRITFVGKNAIDIANSVKGIGMEKGIPILQNINTYLRMVNTMYDPKFLVTNFLRDIQTAGINITSEQSFSIATQTIKNVPKAMRGVYRNLKQSDKIDAFADLYEELQLEGGTTGFFDYKTMDQKLKTLESKLDKVDKKGLGILQTGKGLADMINYANESVESAVRLSLYKSMLDNGYSKKQSAMASKNVTVNFNRKGTWGQLINSGWLFFNASIQGGARTISVIANNPKAQAIVTGIVMTGFMESMYNHYSDDEDDPQYEKMPTWKRDNNWVVQIPGKGFVTIRVPYGFNVFKVLGNITGDYFNAIGKNESVNELELIARFLKSVDASFNPLGGGDLVQTLTPTVLDPMVQWYSNKSWNGAPLKPENVFPPYKSEIELAWDRTSSIPKNMSYWLNKQTGGQITYNADGSIKNVKSGYGDVSPEFWKFLTSYLGGGLGRTVMQTAETGYELSQGNITTENNPLINTFFAPYRKEAELSLIYSYYKNSSRKIYNEVEIAKFYNYINSAYIKGAMDKKKAKQLKKSFKKNQKEMRRDFTN